MPEIAQAALLKYKSRMGAEARNVSVWCVISAQCLYHRACITNFPQLSHSISSYRGGTAMFHASCGACLILLATYYAVSGNRSFFDHVNDKMSVCTCLNDSLYGSGRWKKCSILCCSRSPLTQRVCSRFDVCGISLGGVSVKRRAGGYANFGRRTLQKQVLWGRV